MPLSKYARKQMIKKFARNYSDAEWDKLIQDSEFSRLVFYESPDLLAAEVRAKVVLAKPARTAPVFNSTMSNALDALQTSAV